MASDPLIGTTCWMEPTAPRIFDSMRGGYPPAADRPLPTWVYPNPTGDQGNSPGGREHFRSMPSTDVSPASFRPTHNPTPTYLTPINGQLRSKIFTKVSQDAHFHFHLIADMPNRESLEPTRGCPFGNRQTPRPFPCRKSSIFS